MRCFARIRRLGLPERACETRRTHGRLLVSLHWITDRVHRTISVARDTSAALGEARTPSAPHLHLLQLRHELPLRRGCLDRRRLGLELHHGGVLGEPEGSEGVPMISHLGPDGAEEIRPATSRVTTAVTARLPPYLPRAKESIRAGGARRNPRGLPPRARARFGVQYKPFVSRTAGKDGGRIAEVCPPCGVAFAPPRADRRRRGRLSPVRLPGANHVAKRSHRVRTSLAAWCP